MSGLKGVFKHQYQNCLLDISFEMPAQGFIAIYGRSGSGKSSLLRLIAGLDRAKAGSLWINDQCWQDDEQKIFIPTHERKIGFVSQEPSLFSHLNVRKNLDFGYQRLHRDEQKIHPDEIISFLELEPLLERKTEKLSGGEKQRVALGRALLSSPQVLLLDEPLSALDYISKKEILPYLRALKDRFQLPILYVSHDLPEVVKLCETMLLLDSGRSIDYGLTKEVISRAAGEMINAQKTTLL